MKIIKQCDICGKDFIAKNQQQCVCSSECKGKKNLEAQRKLRERRRKSGLCIKCGKPLEPGTGSECWECKNKESIRHKNRRNSRKKTDNLENIAKQILKYNNEHGTRLSYGKYIAMKEIGKIV